MEPGEHSGLGKPVGTQGQREVLRMCREALREELARTDGGVYVRMLAVLRALERRKSEHGITLVEVYDQLKQLATGAEDASEMVACEAARIVRRGMPEFSSFYTQYVSKAFNKFVRLACQRLQLALVAVLSRAEIHQRDYLYLKWENKADSERRPQRHRSFEASGFANRGPSAFIPGPATVHPRQFFGRERELARLFGLVKSHPMQCAVVVGEPRIGKSSLLRFVETITAVDGGELRPGQRADWLPEPSRHRWIYLDFLDPRLKKAEGVYRAMLGRSGITAPVSLDQERFLEEMGRALEQPTVVLMDHIDKAIARVQQDDENELQELEFWEGLRSLATASGNLAYILASRQTANELAGRFQVFTSPFFNIFGHIIELRALEEAAARELIASSPIPFPSADVDEIVKLSKGLPLALQILCFERLFTLENEDRTDDWRERALRQIEWSQRHNIPE